MYIVPLPTGRTLPPGGEWPLDWTFWPVLDTPFALESMLTRGESLNQSMPPRYYKDNNCYPTVFHTKTRRGHGALGFTLSRFIESTVPPQSDLMASGPPSMHLSWEWWFSMKHWSRNRWILRCTGSLMDHGVGLGTPTPLPQHGYTRHE